LKTLQLKMDDSLYETVLAMLKGLPEEKIKIMEEDKISIGEKSNFDIMQYAGTMKSFSNIEDPVAWQKDIRSEWDREWDK